MALKLPGQPVLTYPDENGLEAISGLDRPRRSGCVLAMASAVVVRVSDVAFLSSFQPPDDLARQSVGPARRVLRQGIARTTEVAALLVFRARPQLGRA